METENEKTGTSRYLIVEIIEKDDYDNVCRHSNAATVRRNLHQFTKEKGIVVNDMLYSPDAAPMMSVPDRYLELRQWFIGLKAASAKIRRKRGR